VSAPIIHRDIVQGTPEWYALRAGKWSASKGAVIMGGLDTSGLDSYIKDLAWERVHGPVEGGFKSSAMERGSETEPAARDWFAFTHDVTVEEVGCVEHATIPNLVWSPDGMFDQDRWAIEAKCPLHKAWMEVKRTGKVPAEYRWQTKFAIATGQLVGLHFVVYHPLAGGLVVPCEVTDIEREQIAERIALLEPKVQRWVDILTDRKAAA
jgi:putative phage-type endonuclease